MDTQTLGTVRFHFALLRMRKNKIRSKRLMSPLLPRMCLSCFFFPRRCFNFVFIELIESDFRILCYVCLCVVALVYLYNVCVLYAEHNAKLIASSRLFTNAGRYAFGVYGEVQYIYIYMNR